jgi:hypothetical protein
MSVFICEKCGKLDNTACSNNYWHALINKHRQLKGEELDICFKPRFSYFENHVCCSDCCEGIIYSDGSGTLHKRSIDIKDKEHWSKYGKEKLLEWERRNDGSMVNAAEYFKSNNI